jgi:hypothetical protein
MVLPSEDLIVRRMRRMSRRMWMWRMRRTLTLHPPHGT